MVSLILIMKKKKKKEYNYNDDENASLLFTLSNILIKLNADCESLRTVDSTEKKPLSLSIAFGVDLTSKTFECLLDIAEKLSKEFYSNKQDNNNNEVNEVRMLCFVVIIKLLRTNINHLISWNIDPYSVGFNNKQRDEIFNEEISNSLTVRQRYVTLLNRLVFDRPTLNISKLLEDEIHSISAECLSIGLSVFYMDPKDRVSILCDHVNGCLSTEKPNPLRLLLASRYFASLTQPHNLIALVPALIKVFKKERKSLLLRSVLQLVYAKKALYSFLDNPKEYINKQKEQNNNNNNNNEPQQQQQNNKNNNN